VTYTQNHSIDISLTVTNNGSGAVLLDSYYGTVNGWGFIFSSGEAYQQLDAGSSADVELTAPLSPALDEMLNITELQNVGLLLQIYQIAESSTITLECTALDNPDCSQDYVQTFPADDSPIYESNPLRVSLADIGWDNHLVYLYVENLVSKAVYLSSLSPAVNGYCSQDADFEGYLPENYGKTILALDLSAITKQYDIDQLKRLALSGALTTTPRCFYGDEYTFSIPVEGGDDQYTPEYDETGSVWIDNDYVKLIYRGIGLTEYGNKGLELLLINKCAETPLQIGPQSDLQIGDETPLINCDGLVAPGSACVVTLKLFPSDGGTLSLYSSTPITGTLTVSASGFRDVATATVNEQP